MEEVKLAIKPYYQKKDITKEEYKDILRKAVHKVGPRDWDWGPGSRRGLRVGQVIESRSGVPGLAGTQLFLVLQICHSKSGEINPVKVSNLVRAYVQRYRYFRKHGRKPGDPPGPPRPPKEPGPPDKGGPGLPLPPL